MSWGYIAVGVGTLAAGVINGQANKPPKTAPLATINPQTQQQAAITGNIQNEDSTEQLLTRANKYTQGQANDLIEQAIPGYGKLSQKLMGIASSNLDNPSAIPQDVEDNLSRIASEKGISTGVNGEAGNFSLLRDLGVNSLNYRTQQIGQAQSILQTVASTAPRVNPLSPTSLWITPQQELTAATGNAAGAQAVGQSANNAAQAASSANASMWGQTVQSLAGVAGGYLNSNANTTSTPSTNNPNLGTTNATTSGTWTWVPGQGYQWKN